MQSTVNKESKSKAGTCGQNNIQAIVGANKALEGALGTSVTSSATAATTTVHNVHNPKDAKAGTIRGFIRISHQ